MTTKKVEAPVKIKFKVMNPDGTISGAFINTMVTFVYLAFIILAIFIPSVADALKKIESFLTWFFVASFGIWSLNKTITTLNSPPKE